MSLVRSPDDKILETLKRPDQGGHVSCEQIFHRPFEIGIARPTAIGPGRTPTRESVRSGDGPKRVIDGESKIEQLLRRSPSSIGEPVVKLHRCARHLRTMALKQPGGEPLDLFAGRSIHALSSTSPS